MSSRQDLQRRLDGLRDFRVRTRKQIERARKMLAFGDELDNRRRIEQLEFNLRHSESEWQQIHLLLGKRLPGDPVKLSARPSARSSVTTRRAPTAYITRVMVPGR